MPRPSLRSGRATHLESQRRSATKIQYDPLQVNATTTITHKNAPLRGTFAMSISLVDALEDVDLKTGQTYRCEVRGNQVEVRVLARPAVGPRDESTALPECDVMIDAWCELPRPTPIGRVKSRLVANLPIDIPPIPSDEESVP